MNTSRLSWLLLITSSMAWSQGSQLPKYTVATLPSASGHPTYTVQVIDGASSSDCTVGGGSFNVLCTAHAGAWVFVAGGAVSYPGVTSPGTGELAGNAGVSIGWQFNPNNLTMLSLPSHSSGSWTIDGGFGGSVSCASDQNGIDDGYLYCNQNGTGWRNVLTAITISGTSPPSDPCSASQNNFAIEINATPTAYQCSNATGSYAWNTLGGGGSVGPGTNKFFACFSGTTNVGNCHADDGGTTPSTITATEPVVIDVPGGAAGSIKFGQGTAPSFTSGNGYIFSDASGNMMSNDNAAGSGNICNTVNGKCQPPTTFQTGGVNNSSQTTLNLVAGTNVTLTNTSGGNVTIAASGGGGSGAVTNITSAITWTGCTVSSGVCTPGSATSSITAASIPGGHNKLIFQIYGNESGTTDPTVSIQFNGDSTSAHYTCQLSGSQGGGSNISTSCTGASYPTTAIFVPSLSISGQAPGSATLEIPFYAEATNHSGTSLGGRALASGAPSNLTSSFNWLPSSGAAITQLLFAVADGSNFATNVHIIVWAQD